MCVLLTILGLVGASSFVAIESTLNMLDKILRLLKHLDFKRYTNAYVTVTFLAVRRFMVMSSFLSLSLARAQFIVHPRREKRPDALLLRKCLAIRCEIKRSTDCHRQTG